MRIKNKGLWIVLFTMPCMLLFALVYAAPIVTVLYTSLCDYSSFSGPVFAGLKNFVNIFGDGDFLESIKNTLVWVLLQSTFHVSLGLVMALVLRRKPKGWKVVRTAYMIPNIVPTAATGVMFTLLPHLRDRKAVSGKDRGGGEPGAEPVRKFQIRVLDRYRYVDFLRRIQYDHLSGRDGGG